ncbi:MAG: AraC family transcriptional regulator [Planctomycetota bacterium]
MDETRIGIRKRRYNELPATAQCLGLRLHSVGEGFWHARRVSQFFGINCHADEVRAIYLHGGRGRFRVADGTWQTVDAGQLCWIPPGETVSYRPHASQLWIEHWITCSGSSIDRWLREGMLPQQALVLTVPPLHADFDRIMRACEQADYPEAAWAALGILRRISTAPTELPEARHPVREQISRIRANPAHAWNLDHLASEAELTRDGLRRAFLRFTEQAPLPFITTCRLDLARQFLLDGYAVAAAAKAAGWQDTGYFSRQFHRHYGCTPRQMRERISAE